MRTCDHNKKYERDDDPMCVEHGMQNFNRGDCETSAEFGMRLDTRVAQHIFELFRKTKLHALKIENGDFGNQDRDYDKEEWMNDGIPGKIVCTWEGDAEERKGVFAWKSWTEIGCSGRNLIIKTKERIGMDW